MPNSAWASLRAEHRARDSGTHPHRRRIDVTVGANGMPAAYTVAITIDHKTMVSAGQSLANGDDVRIVADSGSQLDRVLDTGSVWNDSATKLWFKPNTAAVAAGTV